MANPTIDTVNEAGVSVTSTDAPAVSITKSSANSRFVVSRYLFTSKKFAYAMIGISVSFIFFTSIVKMICENPLVAPSLVSIFNTEISFVAGIIATLLGVHTWMDWSNVQNNATSIISTVDSKTNISKAFNYNFSEEEKKENVAASRTKGND